ncbi:DUF4190 domain-containing protein [Kitasatospora sp. NPDC004289]
MTTQAPPPDATDPWSPPAADAAPAEPAVAPQPAPGYGPVPPPVPGQYPGGAPGVPPYWPPYPMVAPQPRNGPGIAALVLGIVAVVMVLVVLLFWVAWLPALIAVVLGGIGLRNVRRGLATNRGMALAGVVLGVLGLLGAVVEGGFVAWAAHEAVQERKAEENAARQRAEAEIKRLDEERERRRKEAEEKAAKEAAEERARQLIFGQSYTYPDGLKITVSSPEPYAVDRYTRLLDGAKAFQVTITVVNTGSQPAKIAGLPTVREPSGNWYQLLIDGSGRAKFLSSDPLQPGQQSVGKYAYAVLVAPEQLTVEYTPDLVGHKTARWSTTDRSGSV